MRIVPYRYQLSLSIPTFLCLQAIWAGFVRPGDTVVDATCGNGYDSKWLAQAVGPTGTLFAIDIQVQPTGTLLPFISRYSPCTCRESAANSFTHHRC